MSSFQDRPQDDDDPFVGKLIAGNFRLDRLIGSGATGNVYQGEQLSLGKGVAVKILHPHLVGDEKLVKRFQREAKSASRLNHPNSVQIIESGQDAGGALFIAMELLSGRDLAEVIRDEYPMPIARIIHIMSQVFAALDEAHAHGLIHRDLKPSNIMLIERRNQVDFVKVCDYGIAKAPADDAASGGDSQMLTVQGLVCGTPEYMSPEQARGEVLDGRTDLYSAAVILYQMTTGDVPFRAATPIGIVSRHLSEAPIVPSTRRGDTTIPNLLDDLIMRGLAKSRDLRPATAAIFREELELIGSAGVDRRLLANAPTLTATDPRANDTTASLSAQVNKAGTPVRSFKKLGLGLLAVGVLAAGAGAMLRRGGEPTPDLVTSGKTEPAKPVAVALKLKEEPRAEPTEAPKEERKEEPGAGPTAEAPHDEAPASDAKTAGARHKASSTKNTRGVVASSSKTIGHGGKPAEAAAASPAAAPVAAPREVTAVPTEPARPAPSDEKVVSPLTTRGPRELIAEAEKALAQGEVNDACRRGEDLKKGSPRMAGVYKFLGKCYMRAGKAALAKENYRRYLELDPKAPDAVFIESIVK